MILRFITAANSAMASYATQCLDSIKMFGCAYEIYDLGGLGYGVNFPVPATNLLFPLPETEDDLGNSRVSKALFKPAVIKDARKRFPAEVLVWVDADTLLKKEFIIGTGFDIGVAQRPQSELWMEASGNFASQDRIGRYNAGMIIFSPTARANDFIDLWSELTGVLKNDQIALNQALRKHVVDFKIFPVRYNSPKNDSETILHHIKGKKPSNEHE